MREFCHEGHIEAEDVVEFQLFSPVVVAIDIPKHLQILTLDMYVGDSDPVDHLCYFNTEIVIGGATYVVKCRLLPSTFKGTR